MADETPTESAPVEATPAEPVEPQQSEETTEQPEGGESAPPEAAQDSESAESEPADQERLEREKRIDESVKRLNIENRQLKRQLRDISQGQQQRPQIMKPPDQPKLEQFDTIEAYDKALGEWREADRQFAIQQDRIARDREARQQSEAKQMAELRQAWDKRATRVLKANPEFNVVEALGRVEPNPTMDGFFADSEVGPELLDYFDGNPDEADRVRELSPYAAMRELIKLEDKLSLQVKGIKAKPTLVQPPQAARGRASAPAAPKTAADVLYG